MKRYSWALLVLFWGSWSVFGAEAGDHFNGFAAGSARVSTAGRVIDRGGPVDATALAHSSAESIIQEIPLTEAEIRIFKEAVRKVAAETETLTADFSQWRYSRYLAAAAESKGRLSFRKPGHVLWKYTSPTSYSVLFRENKMYLNDAGKKKDMNAGKRLEKLNKLIQGSVTGDMFDAAEFSFSFVKRGEKVVARLKTKEASLKKYIREIELTFDGNRVSELKMIEPSEDYTRVILKNHVLNARIDPAVFVP